VYEQWEAICYPLETIPLYNLSLRERGKRGRGGEGKGRRCASISKDVIRCQNSSDPKEKREKRKRRRTDSKGGEFGLFPISRSFGGGTKGKRGWMRGSRRLNSMPFCWRKRGREKERGRKEERRKEAGCDKGGLKELSAGLTGLLAVFLALICKRRGKKEKKKRDARAVPRKIWRRRVTQLFGSKAVRRKEGKEKTTKRVIHLQRKDRRRRLSLFRLQKKEKRGKGGGEGGGIAAGKRY